MAEKTKIAYQGYVINDSKDLSDDDVIEYEFRNAGTTDCEINGILVTRKSSDYPFNYFKETITENQKNGQRYRIKFLNSDPKKNFLIVIEKRIVYN